MHQIFLAALALDLGGHIRASKPSTLYGNICRKGTSRSNRVDLSEEPPVFCDWFPL